MSPTPNYGWRKQSKYIFDSDRRFEFRRIRDIEIQLYVHRAYVTENNEVPAQTPPFQGSWCLIWTALFSGGVKRLWYIVK